MTNRILAAECGVDRYRSRLTHTHTHLTDKRNRFAFAEQRLGAHAHKSVTSRKSFLN